MIGDILPHLPVFLAVARRRSFAAAASELGISASATSHAVRALERRLGAQVFLRTTRSVSLTETGAALLAAAGPALQGVVDEVERIRAHRGRITGLLRLNVPRIAMDLALAPVLREMVRRHPEVTIEIYAEDALADIVAEGFDAGVRFGEMIDADMIAVRLTPAFESLLVAAPEYLAARGHPRDIADLARHNCIGYRMIRSRGLYRWDLLDDGRPVAVETTGNMIVNDAHHARMLATMGLGIAYLFEPLVRDDLRTGRLARVLPDSAVREEGLFLYFPRRASQTPKLRSFIDTARDVLAPG